MIHYTTSKHAVTGMTQAFADAVAFLVSDEASFITAEHLSIDGGAQYF